MARQVRHCGVHHLQADLEANGNGALHLLTTPARRSWPFVQEDHQASHDQYWCELVFAMKQYN